MDFNKKIEEIRKKPEHVRMRYVWASVAIAMFFIFITWLFSLQEIFKNTAPQPADSESFKKGWDEVKKGMPSIEEFMKRSEEEVKKNEISPQEGQPIPENEGRKEEVREEISQ